MCNCNSNCGNRGLFGGMDDCTWIIILIVLFFLFCNCGNNSGCGNNNGCGCENNNRCGCDNGCGC